MRIVVSWLRELCPTDLSTEELAEVLTAKGVHVEDVQWPWANLSGVVVARVLEVRDHPDSDNLCLARVTDGERETELVVGVRNMVAGDLVPLAPPGARVPSLPEPLTAREIRGVVSDGMLCSPWELRVSEDHGAILVLPEGSPLGRDVASLLGLSDAVFDIEIEPNRPDLMSVLGVAREAAAATGAPLAPPDTTVDGSSDPASSAATVEVRDLERCPRYVARVIRGVGFGPSPLTVQVRLTASGMRPLSNVVDATNYAMLELGQPLHAFDLDRLDGGGIVVRRAEEGETILTLDDVERTLVADDLVIADHAKAVAVAGVMGSAAAEVSGGTRDVLLESAHFERRGIMRTRRRLGLSTEASQRFERGIDPEGVSPAAARAAALIAAWSGGTVLAGEIDVGAVPERRRVGMRSARATALLGYPVSAGDAGEVFARLGLGFEDRNGELRVEVPGYRVDIEREVDLIEEVARMQGYDLVGSTLPSIRQPGGTAESYAFRGRIREALRRAGFRETRSTTFVPASDVDLLGGDDGEGPALAVANPLVADERFLRVALVPGLLRALARNAARQVRSASLFEVGAVFRSGEPVREREHVALAAFGSTGTGHPGERGEIDFFDAKGAVGSLFGALGIEDWALGEALDEPLHPGRSAEVLVGGEPAGFVGELHPSVAAGLDIPGRVAVAELGLDPLRERAGGRVTYRELPRFPPVHRDLAFLLPADAPAGEVRGAIVESAGGLASSVELFDVFAGGPIPEGRKSLAFSVDFRAPDRTLTDEEADAAVRAIVERVAADFGGELRSG